MKKKTESLDVNPLIHDCLTSSGFALAKPEPGDELRQYTSPLMHVFARGDLWRAARLWSPDRYTMVHEGEGAKTLQDYLGQTERLAAEAEALQVARALLDGAKAVRPGGDHRAAVLNTVRELEEFVEVISDADLISLAVEALIRRDKPLAAGLVMMEQEYRLQEEPY